LVADPPRTIVPGDSDGWGALLARQGPMTGPAPSRSRASGPDLGADAFVGETDLPT